MRGGCVLRAALLALVQVVLTAGPLWAQPAAVPTDGRTCFCLRHRSGQSLAGYVGSKAPNDFYATATCGAWDGPRALRPADKAGRSPPLTSPEGDSGVQEVPDRHHCAVDGDAGRGGQPARRRHHRRHQGRDHRDRALHPARLRSLRRPRNPEAHRAEPPDRRDGAVPAGAAVRFKASPSLKQAAFAGVKKRKRKAATG